MKIVNKYTTLLSLCAAFAACSDNEVLPDNPATGGETGEKTPIVLSVGGVDSQEPLTRAVITDKDSRTFEKFPNGTNIYMVMKSDFNTTVLEPYKFLGGQDPKYCVTAGASGADGKIVFVGDRIRYWDDAHARSSMLSIWAIACPGANPNFNGTTYNDNTIKFNTTTGLQLWNTTKITATSIEWNVPNAGTTEKHQTEESCKNRDLVFSNNIVDYTSQSKTDRRLTFDTSTKKFKDGELVFYRAMSKITIKIMMGEGFTGTNDFRFLGGGTDDKNIRLHLFNIWGKFDVSQGIFTEVNKPYNGSTGHADICSMWNHNTTPDTSDQENNPAYTLEALVLPYCNEDSKPIRGSVFTNTDDEALDFYIDNNKYIITREQLLKALTENNVTADTDGEIKMEAGKNYVFTFTVGKTKIKNITAQVATWENVDADNISPTNARIKLKLEERGEPQISGVAFYKAEDNKTTDGVDDNYVTYNWETGYTKMNATYSTNHWTTNLFWQSNKDFYHFRSIKPEGTAVNTNASEGDNLSLTSGVSYTDICWGAPMLDDAEDETPSSSLKWNYGPTANGFDGLDSKVATEHQIYKAIGPTEDPVKLIMFHMMSDVTFNIKTTTGTDAVTLVDAGDKKTKVEIVGLYPNGKVLLGNGLVKTTGDATTIQIDHDSESSGTHIYKYGVVPQDLATSANTNAGVQLRITTPDNNQYIVDLKDVKATAISTNNLAIPYSKNNDSKYVINRWYPGFKYVYSFTLKKTGIDDLKVTILDWETITADEQEVQIK